MCHIVIHITFSWTVSSFHWSHASISVIITSIYSVDAIHNIFFLTGSSILREDIELEPSSVSVRTYASSYHENVNVTFFDELLFRLCLHICHFVTHSPSRSCISLEIQSSWRFSRQNLHR